MEEVKKYIEEELKKKIAEFLYNECRELLKEYIAQVSRECITEAWLQIIDLPITIEQAAALYNVDKAVIYKWKQRKKLPFYKHKGKIYVNLRDIIHDIITAPKRL